MSSLAEFIIDEAARAPSQTSTAYARLRGEILAGRYASGARLKVAELAAALSVNPGAVREALSRLVSEQLVVARDQRGFIAAPLTIEDLQDLTELRCDLEEMALSRSLARGDAEWEASILAAAHRLRRTHAELGAERYTTPEWKAQHARFHAALVGACGSPRLLALHAQLYQQSERYRGLALHFATDRKVEDEHQALADAALDRDPERLIGLALTHLTTTTDLIVAEARRSHWGVEPSSVAKRDDEEAMSQTPDAARAECVAGRSGPPASLSLAVSASAAAKVNPSIEPGPRPRVVTCSRQGDASRLSES